MNRYINETVGEIMTNLSISKTDNNTYLVRGDSKRFGKNAILFESYKKSDCKAYVKRIGETEKDMTLCCSTLCT